MTIDAAKVKELARQYKNARYPWDKERLGRKLDELADKRKFKGYMVVGENGADSDEATELLWGRGTLTVAETVTTGPSPPPRQADYRDGLAALGIPYDEFQTISSCLNEGNFPPDALDAIVSQEQIRRLHPDKYPWDTSVFDLICAGLDAAKIDCAKIWQGVERTLAERGRPDLVATTYRMPRPSESLAVLLEHYALTKHDIKKLDMTRREVHF